MSFVHKTREKDVVGILTSDLIGLLPTNHNIAYITMEYTGVCEETFDFISIIAQTTQNFHCRKVKSTRNIDFGGYREIPDSNLETGRNCSKSGVSRIIREC